MSNNTIEVASVMYRFNRDMLETYYEMFKSAQQAGRRMYIYASLQARGKIAETFLAVFTKEELDEIKIRAYPGNRLSAMNFCRGAHNCSALFIDEKGKFTDTIKQVLSAVGNVDALIVCNKYDPIV